MIDEEAIFAEALSRAPPHERAAYLEQACGGDAALRARVEMLLAAHDRAGEFLESPPPAVAITTASAPLAERPGTIVGPYKLLEQIGEGGMGVVFMAEQLAPVRRKVALKIIKPGLDTKQVVARFEAERQALALMDHPNIAKVFDAGATDAGRPYFVMELVRGVPITEYCDRHQLNPRQRLELFVQVCQAVQHAHTKGIIHRDLKPTNVLVTLQEGKPVPKIIDFGIAKATAGQRLTDRTLFTEFRQLIGTPLYMSPEQAEMNALLDVDTRSDVYSLGVLLYELLTGTTPFDKQRLAKAAYDEVRRIIREEDPPRPSTRLSTLGETLTTVSAQRQTDPKRLSAIVRGELDWIVMRALEKDRTRRYQTAIGVAHDVERYLADQPVEACPPSRRYRLRKFARRNKAVITTSIIVLVVLMVATIISTWQAVHATRAERIVVRQRDEIASEKNRADTENAEGKAVYRFLTTMLAAANPERLLGDKVTVLQVTREAVKRLDEGELKDQPIVEAAVRHTIGTTLRSLGRFDEAEPVLRKALELRRRALPAGHQQIAVSLTAVAYVLREQGRLREADPLLKEALDISRKLAPPDNLDVARNLTNLGTNLEDQRRLDEAEPLLRQAVQIKRNSLPPGDPGLADEVNNLALLLDYQGKLAEAEALFREALELNRRGKPAGHPNIAICLINLGVLLGNTGKLAESEALCREALEIQRKAYPAGHPKIALGLSTLASVLSGQCRWPEAEALYREALDLERRSLAPEHPSFQSTLHNLVLVLLDEQKPQEAEPLCRELLRIRRASLRASHPDIPLSIVLLGRVLQAEGKLAEAEPLLREAVTMFRDPQTKDPQGLASSLDSLGWCLREQKKLGEAEQLLREALNVYRGALPVDHPFVANEMRNLGRVVMDAQRFAEAEQLFREALNIRRKVLPPGHPDIVESLEDVGYALQKQSKFAEAEAVLLEANEALRLNAPSDARTRYALQRIVELYEKWPKPDEAAKWRAKLPATRPASAPATAATSAPAKF